MLLKVVLCGKINELIMMLMDELFYMVELRKYMVSTITQLLISKDEHTTLNGRVESTFCLV